MVIAPARRAGDPGSIPGPGEKGYEIEYLGWLLGPNIVQLIRFWVVPLRLHIQSIT